MAEPTILVALTAAVLRAAEGAGADGSALRRAAGLTEADLRDPDARVALERHLRLIEAVSALTPPIGLELGRRLGAEGLGVVGYAMQHDATLERALAWLERYRAVVFDDVLARVERGRERVSFTHAVSPRLAKLRQPAELWAAAQLATLRTLTGKELRPIELHLPHARPADVRRHDAILGCPIVWDAPRIELHMDARILALPLARANPELFGYLARRADALSAELVELPFGVRVRRLIEEGLADGEPDIDGIARKLAVSARTLQRRLGEDGVAFSELLDDVRRERALVIVGDARLTVSQVSYLLGYSEPSAFFRAFKRWTGKTPKAFREQD